jgi:hypothetical protein
MGYCRPVHFWIKSPMPRELTWLEDSTFAAWGCSECKWIRPSLGTDKPSAKVLEGFQQHDCLEFPPHKLPSHKRPSSTVQK